MGAAMTDPRASIDHTHGLPAHEARGLYSSLRYRREHGVRPNSIDLARLLKAEDRLAKRRPGLVLRMIKVYAEYGEYNHAAKRMAALR